MHDTLIPAGLDAVFDVPMVTRVEGEGSLRLRVRNGVVEEARLAIFEAPRYFEKLVVGRTPDEVIDIVARICGICPIAYQMSAVHAFEDLFGVEVDPEVRRLRRLLYCGEWIESHALHVYLLHLPDFLGYPSAVELARDHRPAVEQALLLKRTGNRLVKLLGGRPIHPISVRVGGFSRVPRRSELEALRPELEAAVAQARATLDLVTTLHVPEFEREPRLVALRHPAEYPFNDGRIVSNDGIDLRPSDWREAFHEEHHEGSNALHARTADGGVVPARARRAGRAGRRAAPSARRRGAPCDRAGRPHPAQPVLVDRGPGDRAHRRDGRGARHRRRVSPAGRARPSPGRRGRAWPPGRPRPRGACCSIATRWTSEVGSRPPRSSRRRARTRARSRPTSCRFAPHVLDLPHDQATIRLEQLIRSYDPCISCATHFLDLSIERG